MKIEIVARIASDKTFEYDVSEAWLENWKLENDVDDIEDLIEDERIILGMDIWNDFEGTEVDEDINDQEILSIYIESPSSGKAQDTVRSKQPIKKEEIMKTKFNFHATYEERNEKRKAKDALQPE
jgi:hypothetical protein